MTGTALAVLDFAGTLSFDTVRFGRPGRLSAALRTSGLAALGVDDPDTFWSHLVEPTWERGSTTGVGYATVLADALTRLRRARGAPVDRTAVRSAAEAFMTQYLANSTVAAAWRPWLRRLAAADAAPVIATDHYAEWTTHIVAQLDDAGVGGVRVGDAGRTGGAVAVANSADIGAHKADLAFWAAVRRSLPPAPEAVLVVDDFGATETAGSSYGDPRSVQRRRDRTVAVLMHTFGVTPAVHAVDVADGAETAAVDRAGRWLMHHVGAQGHRAARR